VLRVDASLPYATVPQARRPYAQARNRGAGLAGSLTPSNRRNFAGSWSRLRVARGLRTYGPEAVLDVIAVGGAYALADLLRTGGRFEVLAPTDPAVIFLASLGAGILQVIFNIAFSVYWRNWNFAAIEDVLALAKATVLTMAVLLVLDLVTDSRFMPIGAILAGASFVLVVETGLKLRPRWPEILRAAIGRSRATEKLIVVGAGRMGQLLAADLANGNSMYRIACFVDDDRAKTGSYVRGVRVSGTVDDLPGLIATHRPTFVVVAIAAAPGALIRRLVAMTEDTSTGVRRVTGFSDFQANRTPLRTIGIEELLGREPVRFDTPEAKRYLAGATVLVTGAAGSIGAELSRRLAELGPKKLLLLDSNETGLYWLEKRIQPIGEATMLLGDIRDEKWLESVFAVRRPTIVFHAAAYKHVPLLESAPLQGIMTNVLGTANLLSCCQKFRVQRFVLISTDKAVEPTNVLGYTKRLAELLVVAEAKARDARYAVVRFGNVLGSSGSAVPTFTEQIERGGPVTVTHPDATRFCMTVDEAASLVVEAGALAESGDVMVLDMGAPISILDLAKRMIRLQGLRMPADIEVAFTGLRPGEKLHERLFLQAERPMGTEHPRVMRVSNVEPPALASLRVALREIEARIADQDEAGALEIVMRTVDAHDRTDEAGSDLAATRS
jgi:FlaA1/EpsC-like NDP-sugar epimerase